MLALAKVLVHLLVIVSESGIMIGIIWCAV